MLSLSYSHHCNVVLPSAPCIEPTGLLGGQRAISLQLHVAVSQVSHLVRIASALGLKGAWLAEGGVLYVQAKVPDLVLVLFRYLLRASASNAQMIKVNSCYAATPAGRTLSQS